MPEGKYEPSDGATQDELSISEDEAAAKHEEESFQQKYPDPEKAVNEIVTGPISLKLETAEKRLSFLQFAHSLRPFGEPKFVVRVINRILTLREGGKDRVFFRCDDSLPGGNVFSIAKFLSVSSDLETIQLRASLFPGLKGGGVNSYGVAFDWRDKRPDSSEQVEIDQRTPDDFRSEE